MPVMQETWVQSLGQEDLLEKGTATHSNILAWRISWTEAPSRLQSMGVTESNTHQQNSSVTERIHQMLSTLDGTKLALRYTIVQF